VVVVRVDRVNMVVVVKGMFEVYVWCKKEQRAMFIREGSEVVRKSREVEWWSMIDGW
jgi:hypothetical protein